MAANLAALETNGVDLAELGRAIGNMERVTAANVQEFAKAHWRTGNCASWSRATRRNSSMSCAKRIRICS